MSHNIIPDLSQLKVLFLVGSQALYGEETLRQVDEQSEAILAQLRASSDIPVTIEPHQLLTDTDGIHQAVLAANADPSVIGVITWMHTFSPAKMWIRGLEALQKPLLHWHTQAGVALPYADLDFDFMNLNQSAHGDREFGYILTRLGIARKSVIGHVSDPRVTREIGWWTRAAAGWNEVNGLKVARFGDNMRYVAVTEGDKTEAEAVFGVAVNTWAVNELADAIERASDAEVARTMAEYDEQFEVVPELRADGARRGALRDAARIEVGLRAVLEAADFHAFTDTFEDLGSLPQLPGIAVQRLNLDGYGFGAEGDWKTAILVRVAKVMGAGLPGGASLMEDYTYDLTPGDETILGAHMLEVCPSLTSRRARLEIHPLDIGGKSDPVRAVFTADPGPAVVVALSDMRDRFRLTANVVDIVEPEHSLPKLPVGRAFWKPRPNFVTSAKSWLASGAAHHTVMSSQVPVEVFADFARMAGTELAVIDEHTSPQAFQDALNWNSGYYRLHRGV
ncbi:MAG: L-arabinose isomerase [Propionibacterium sp.]|nr:MAG: L-arabinose isomerase [Propionibacterium sp.]